MSWKLTSLVSGISFEIINVTWYGLPLDFFERYLTIVYQSPNLVSINPPISARKDLSYVTTAPYSRISNWKVYLDVPTWSRPAAPTLSIVIHLESWYICCKLLGVLAHNIHIMFYILQSRKYHPLAGPRQTTTLPVLLYRSNESGLTGVLYFCLLLVL